MASGQLMHQQMNFQIRQQNQTQSQIISELPCHQSKDDSQHDHVLQKHHGQTQYVQPLKIVNAHKQSEHSHLHAWSCSDMSNQISNDHHQVIGHTKHDASVKHAQCNDCVQSHCQASPNIGVLGHHLDVVMVNAENNISQDYPVDQSQHLLGFWQEILRPPKA